MSKLNKVEKTRVLGKSHARAGFQASDFDKDVEPHRKNGKIPAVESRGVSIIDTHGKPVYAVVIKGKDREKNGRQYYADEDGKPILVNGEPVWNWTRNVIKGGKISNASLEKKRNRLTD